jgi:amino acid adenylation domain-containing protein
MSRVVTNPIPEAKKDIGDHFFWQSRLDDSRPRASLAPDYMRVPGSDRGYDEARFVFDPDAVRALKSMEPSRGITDVALCAATLSLVLAKHQREDELVSGLAIAGGGELAVVPLVLPCYGNLAFSALVQKVEDELAAVGQRSAQFLAQGAIILGPEATSAGPLMLELAFGVEAGGEALDPRALGFDIAIIFEVQGVHVSGRVAYVRDLYRRERMQALATHFERAASEASKAPTTLVKNFTIIGDDEHLQVVRRFNEHSSRYPLEETLHGLFEQQSRKTPDTTAAIHNGVHISYQELNGRANQVASALLSLGLQRGSFVGILLHRSIDFLVAVLGVMKAGGAYVPLDPTYPEDRIRYMLADSDASLVIANGEMIGQYSEALCGTASKRTVISMAGESHLPLSLEGQVSFVAATELAARATDNHDLALGGRDRAYMIYTSGSTGLPKGAICRHDGAINHLFGELDGVGIQSAFRFLQTAASSSDISVWQFLAPLVYGGATVVVDYEAVVDPVLLYDLLQRERIDLAEPVPIVLRGLLDHVEGLPAKDRALPALRCMMASGEALPVELANRWLRLYPDIPIANTYGPTETSDDVTQFVAREQLAATAASVPIGPPLPNVRIFVLDRYLQAVPMGTPGEICIAGIAVGEGYWKQPAKTEAAFVPCPFPEVADGAMYRTGDLGRWLPDGSIEFLGRIDQQVKVRGFRVEPGEIEAVMTAHPAVQDAAVVAVESGNGLRLAGYYVVRSGQQLPATDLRRHLTASLAEHMVPSALIPLQALPTTPLGKTDRRALAKADYRQSSEGRTYVAPRTATETAVAEIWSRVLGTEGVSADDNFFEVGGDSILTIQVIAALRKKGFAIAPRQLFIHPCLSDLARWIDEVGSVTLATETAPEVPAKAPGQFDKAHWQSVLGDAFTSLEDVYSLSATQRGIYYQSLLMRRNSGAYVEQYAFDIEGALDPRLFEQAWNHVTRETAVLRTAIVRRRSPQPVQVVLGECSFAIHEVDLRLMSQSERDARFGALQAEDRARGYDLARPPLARGLLARLGERQWRFLWSYQHLILDGWSEPLVLDDVLRTYAALAASQPPPILSQPSYRDFVGWLEAQPLGAAEKYWRSQLAGFEAPVSIVDPSPGVTPPASTELLHGVHDAEVTAADFARLNEECHRNRITLSTLIHGAWALLLCNRCSVDDVMFGSVASGRQCEVPGIESIRGLVVTTQPLRVRLSPDSTFGAWLRLLQLQMAEMREYEHTPLASIQQWSDVPPEKRPLFDSLVDIGNYHNVDLAASRVAGMKLTRVRYGTQPLYPLTLFVVVGAEPVIRLVYDRSRYAPATVRGLVAELMSYLRAFVENPEERIAGVRDGRAK